MSCFQFFASDNEEIESSEIYQKDDIELLIITSKNDTDKIQLSHMDDYCNNLAQFQATKFKKEWDTMFVIHGFLSGEEFIKKFQKDFFKDGMNNEINLIGVDWSKYADLWLWNYCTAAHNTKMVGERVGKFIRSAIDAELMNIDSIRLIGHSLGAHVAGFIGKQVRKGNGVIPKITALDPARPKFSRKECDKRLCEDDALWVEVIHTSSLGIQQPIGKVDFYLNRNNIQPSSFFVIGAHTYAHKFYRKISVPPRKVKGWWHNNLNEMKARGKWRGEEQHFFGPKPQKTISGVVYIRHEVVSRVKIVPSRAQPCMKSGFIDMDLFEEKLSYEELSKEELFEEDINALKNKDYIIFGANTTYRKDFINLFSNENCAGLAIVERNREYVIESESSWDQNPLYFECRDTTSNGLENFFKILQGQRSMRFVIVFGYDDLFKQLFWDILLSIIKNGIHRGNLLMIAMNMPDNEDQMDDLDEISEIIREALDNDNFTFEMRKISAFRGIGPLDQHSYLNADIDAIRTVLNS